MSIPLNLIELNNPELIVRGYNLGLKVVPNILHVLSQDDLEYWEGHLPDMKDALAKSLVRSKQIQPAKPKPSPKKPITPIFLPSVISNGRSGKEWISHFEANKYQVSNWTKNVLTINHKDGKLIFVVTTGVVYKPVVIKGEEFSDEKRTTENVRKLAAKLKYITPPAELAMLIREAISDEEMAGMGLWGLVTMHEPIIDSGGDPSLLASLRGVGGRWLDAYYGGPAGRLVRQFGFVFLAPQD